MLIHKRIVNAQRWFLTTCAVLFAFPAYSSDSVKSASGTGFGIVVDGGVNRIDGHRFVGTFGNGNSTERAADFKKPLYMYGGAVGLNYIFDPNTLPAQFGSGIELGYEYSRYQGGADERRDISLSTGFNRAIDGSNSSGLFGAHNYQTHTDVEQHSDLHSVKLGSTYSINDNLSFSPAISFSIGQIDTSVFIRQYSLTNNSKHDIDVDFDTTHYQSMIGGTFTQKVIKDAGISLKLMAGANRKHVSLRANDLNGIGTSLFGSNNGAGFATSVREDKDINAFVGKIALGSYYQPIEAGKFTLETGVSYDSAMPSYDMNSAQGTAMHITERHQTEIFAKIGFKYSF